MTLQEFNKRFSYNPVTDSLGGGGFGKIFKAWDNENDCYVALKIQNVDPQFPEVRLGKEVSMAAALKHPNVARYKECHTFNTMTGEVDIAIMSYYESGSLDKLLENVQLSFETKVDILTQTLHGIAYLHNHNVIHRDLKPQNILILHMDGRYIPKITDFGISKQLKDGEKSSVVNSSKFVSRLYASPEQLMGEYIKKNTDIWSFGVIAYQMFVGKTPFDTGEHTFDSEVGRTEFFRQVTSGILPKEIQLIPDKWRQIVSRCLTVSNQSRYAQAEDVLNDIDVSADINNGCAGNNNNIPQEEKTCFEDINKPASSSKKDNKQSNEPKKSKKGWIWIVLGILLLLLAGGVVGYFISNDRSKEDTADTVDTEEQSDDDIAIDTEDEELLEEFIELLSQVEAEAIEYGVIESVRIAEGDIKSFTCYAAAGDILTAIAVGDGDTDLDMFILDNDFNPIMADTEDEDVCQCEWEAESSGYYTFAIVNWDDIYNDCDIVVMNSTSFEEKGCVNAGATNEHYYYGVTDYRVTICVEGDGDTDLDLYIYDSDDNLVAKDTGIGDQCMCKLTPEISDIYTLEVRNRGSIYNDYTIYVK